MSLYPPYFIIQTDEGKTRVRHNCNGGVQFNCWEELTDETVRLIEMAIEEGKRQKAKEIADALGLGSKK